MKTITLKQIDIENFRSIRQATYGLSTPQTQISGRNGTGKTTIYNAYCWCVFGKDTDGRQARVQPLGTDGNPPRKVVTTVTVTLIADGREVTLQRSQREDWQVPRGKAQEILKGYIQNFSYDGVPCTATQYNERVTALCDPKEWHMLTSVSAFMSIDTKERRAILTRLASSLPDTHFAQHLPAVLEALQDGKTIDDLARQTTTARKKTKADLDEIPARIDQAEKMRPAPADYTAIEERIASVEREIADLDTRLAADTDTPLARQIEQLQARRQSALAEMDTLLSDARLEADRQRQDLTATIRHLRSLLDNATLDADIVRRRIDTLNTRLQEKAAEREDNRSLWIRYNEQEWSDTISTQCPACGAPMPEDRLEEIRDNDFRLFERTRIQNRDKCEKIERKLSEEYREIQTQLNTETARLARLTSDIDAIPPRITAHEEQYRAIQPALTDTHPDILRLKEQARQAQQEIDTLTREDTATADLDTIRANKAELQSRLKSLTQALALRDTDLRVTAAIDDLNTQSRDLAQALATLDHTLAQITDFRHIKIDHTEQAISGKFSIVRWKMFESNITNDGEKEICQAIVGGVPYEQLNTASRVNAGIDIINGLSTALGVRVPLFIDNKESVTELMETETQTICLTVKDCGLTVG